MVSDETLAAKHVLFCGYFLLPRMRGPATAALMEKVRARGRMTLLDTGWDTDGWGRATRDEVLGLLPLADVFLPNEIEAAALTAAESAAEAARVLQRYAGRAGVAFATRVASTVVYRPSVDRYPTRRELLDAPL